MTELLDDDLELEPFRDSDKATKSQAAQPKSGITPHQAVPWPIPLLRVSGRYEIHPRLLPIHPIQPIPSWHPGPSAKNGTDEAVAIPIPWPLLRRGILHLDVDDNFPQNTASGTLQIGLQSTVHWVARLARVSGVHWTGNIWYKDGAAASFPYTSVDIQLTNALSPQREATVRFKGSGLADAVFQFEYRSRSYYPVEFEFDHAPDAHPVFSIDTHAHPNHPSTLAAGTLSIQDVYSRAGFEVSTSPGSSEIPKALAGADGMWSDMELHDAMQTYWSRFANKAQWAMWVFFGALHEQGTSLGGVMFDDIGPNHRQGTSIFSESFIKNPPAGDAAPAAWVKRMVFWTACHEMGHGFNLAHSWQKAMGTPWIPIANEPEARSFMNYPYNVTGGQTAFFSDFRFRFSDPELLFMRHAPERFVEMGNAAWFDHHGFEQAAVSAEPAFRLDLRLNRPQKRLQFIEPAMVDVVLTNVSEQPKLVRERILTNLAALTVVVKREGRPAREYRPYASYCSEPALRVMRPKESMIESIFLGADRASSREGWLLAEPGNYTVQALLRVGEEEIVSAPLQVRVDTPNSYEEERLAQDFFSDEVGRVLFFDGSNVLKTANDTLRELIGKLPSSCAAIHAGVALARAASGERKVLDLTNETRQMSSASNAKGKVSKVKSQPGEAQRLFKAALESKPDLAAQSLGQSDFQFYVDRYAETLASESDRKQLKTLRDRASQVHRDDGDTSRPPKPR